MFTFAYLAFVDFRFPKNEVLRQLECFFGKMAESRPPLKLKNNGGLLSAIFSKNHSQCLKLTLENGQKSGFYKVKFPKLQRAGLPWVPQVFDQKNIRMSSTYV